MTPPRFWREDGVAARLLAPASAIVAAATARRVARPGWTAPVPVLCCGNASVGGTGKTPVALDLGARLLARGRRVAFLSRGFGGRGKGVRRASGFDDAGDEPMLLDAVAPCWLGSDRAASARAAIAHGADVLVMDDGLQNPGLRKTMSLLVVDAGAGFGNGRVIPAGPLREPAAAAAARCRAIVLIGDGPVPALGLPVLRADLQARPNGFAGRTMLAFAGIGRPAKFFATLASAGAVVVAERAFPDHHRFDAADLDRLARDAAMLGAVLVTTAKDAVRLPPEWRGRIAVLEIDLVWHDPARVEALLDEVLA